MDDKLTDSDTLDRAHATLRAQEAKGRAKYGADLDTANLSARQVLQHATEEAADLLMYLTDLPRRLEELEAELTHARGLLADLRRPWLPDGTAREVEAAADAYLAGKPVDRTIGTGLCVTEEDCGSKCARVAELEAENERLRAEAARWVPYAAMFASLPRTCPRGQCKWVRSGTGGAYCALCGDVDLPDFGMSAAPATPTLTTRPLTTGPPIPVPKTFRQRVSSERIYELGRFGDMAIDGTPVMHLLCDLAGALREASDAWALVAEIRATARVAELEAENERLKGKCSEPAPNNAEPAP